MLAELFEDDVIEMFTNILDINERCVKSLLTIKAKEKFDEMGKELDLTEEDIYEQFKLDDGEISSVEKADEKSGHLVKAQVNLVLSTQTKNPDKRTVLKYKPRYIDFDDNEQYLKLDLDELQDEQAKFKGINLFKGNVVFRINYNRYHPEETDEIEVFTGDFEIPEKTEGIMDFHERVDTDNKVIKLFKNTIDQQIILIFKDGGFISEF